MKPASLPPPESAGALGPEKSPRHKESSASTESKYRANVARDSAVSLRVAAGGSRSPSSRTWYSIAVIIFIRRGMQFCGSTSSGHTQNSAIGWMRLAWRCCTTLAPFTTVVRWLTSTLSSSIGL